MPDSSDSFDDLWELAEAHVCETYVLRSFLEYLRDGDDPPEKKLERARNWKVEISIALANSKESEKVTKLFRTLRDCSPKERRVAVLKVLAEADALYARFPGSK
jgi:hypothetical protein